MQSSFMLLLKFKYTFKKALKKNTGFQTKHKECK